MLIRILIVALLAFLGLASQAQAGTARFVVCPTDKTDANNSPMQAGINLTSNSLFTPLRSYLSPQDSTSSTFSLLSRATQTPQWVWRNFETNRTSPDSTTQGAYPGMVYREALNNVGQTVARYDFGNACLGPDPSRTGYTGGDSALYGRNGLEVSADVHSTTATATGRIGRWVFRAPVGNPSNDQSVGISAFQGDFSWHSPAENTNGFFPVSALYNNSDWTNSSRDDLYCLLGKREATTINDWFSPLRLTFSKGATGRGDAVNDGAEGCQGFGTSNRPLASGSLTRDIGNTQAAATNKLRKIWYTEMRCSKDGGCTNVSGSTNNRRVSVNNVSLTVDDNESPGYFLNTSTTTINDQQNLAAGPGTWKRGTGYLNFSYGDSGLGLDQVLLDNRLPNSEADILNSGQGCTEWSATDRSQGQFRLSRALERNRYDFSIVADSQTGACEAWYEYRRTGIDTAQWPDGNININSLAYDYSVSSDTRNYSWNAVPVWVDNTAPSNVGMTLNSAGSPLSSTSRFVRGALTVSATGQEQASSTASGLRALYVIGLQTNASGASSTINNLKTQMVPGTNPAVDDFYASLYQFPGCQAADPTGAPLVKVSSCSYDTTLAADGQEIAVLLRATDNANNGVTVDTGNVIVDNTRPAISTTASTGLGADNTTYANQAVTIPVQVQDPVSGVAAVDYCISNQAGVCATWTTLSPATAGATSYTPEITVSSSSFLNLRARDRAGNSYPDNQIVTVPVRIDSNPPTLEIEGNLSSWTNDPGLAARVFRGSDPGGGIEKISWSYVSGQQAGDPSPRCGPQESGGCGFQYSLLSSPIEYSLTESFAGISSGQRVIEASVVDRAGNTSSATTELKLDFVSPTVSAVSAEQSGTGRQTLSATVNDTLSGPGTASFEICTTSDQCPSLGGTAWVPLEQSSAPWARCVSNLNGVAESSTEKSYSCQLRVNDVVMPDGGDRIYVRLKGRDQAGNETTGAVTSVPGPSACPVVN
jgi:hypothetical protein